MKCPSGAAFSFRSSPPPPPSQLIPEKKSAEKSLEAGASKKGSCCQKQSRCACAGRVGSGRDLRAGPGVLYHLETLQIGKDATHRSWRDRDEEGSKSQGEGVAAVGRPPQPAGVALLEVMEGGGGGGQGG